MKSNGLFKLEQKRVYPPASFYFRTKEDVEEFKEVFFQNGLMIPWEEPIQLGPIKVKQYEVDVDKNPTHRAITELSWGRYIDSKFKELNIDMSPDELNNRVKEIMDEQRKEIETYGYKSQMDRYAKISGIYGKR